MRKAHSLERMLTDERGQATVEFLMLMVVSVVAGFLILVALGQALNGLYGKLEGEVSRPAHF